jgi:hypothetical protein
MPRQAEKQFAQFMRPCLVAQEIGSAYARDGNIQKAIELYERCLPFAPDTPVSACRVED